MAAYHVFVYALFSMQGGIKTGLKIICRDFHNEKISLHFAAAKASRHRL